MNLYFIRAFLHPILVRHAAQAPTTPDGTVRVRMYWIHSLLGFAGIFLGLLLLAVAGVAWLLWRNTAANIAHSLEFTLIKAYP